MSKVYKTTKLRMGTEAMASFLYALIMTKSELVKTFGVGIYSLERKINSYNLCDMMITIAPDEIDRFQDISGCKLKDVPEVSLR